MTENTPEATTPASQDSPAGEGTPPTSPAGDATSSGYVPAGAVHKVTVPEGNKGSGRWAVYDKVLERYVGSVQDTKPSATDAKAAAQGHGYAIVEV